MFERKKSFIMQSLQTIDNKLVANKYLVKYLRVKRFYD